MSRNRETYCLKQKRKLASSFEINDIIFHNFYFQVLQHLNSEPGKFNHYQKQYVMCRRDPQGQEKLNVNERRACFWSFMGVLFLVLIYYVIWFLMTCGHASIYLKLLLIIPAIFFFFAFKFLSVIGRQPPFILCVVLIIGLLFLEQFFGIFRDKFIDVEIKSQQLQDLLDLVKDSKLFTPDAPEEVSNKLILSRLELCSNKELYVPNYFEREWFTEQIQNVLSLSPFLVFLGANNIGKSVAFKKYAESRRNYTLYFDLTMFKNQIHYSQSNPCSILSFLDVTYFSDEGMRFYSNITRNEYNQKPVIIFDQADSLLMHSQQTIFMDDLVQSFGHNAFSSTDYSVIFIGSESHIVGKYFDSGGKSARATIIYSPGFTAKEVCYLWIDHRLITFSLYYNKMKQYQKEICELFISEKYDEQKKILLSEKYILAIDPLLSVTEIQAHHVLFWETYQLAGDFYEAMRSSKSKTVAYIKRIHQRYCKGLKLVGNSTIDHDSVSFLTKLVNKTKNGFDSHKQSQFQTEQVNSAAALSNLIRIETISDPDDPEYKFRIPLFRDLQKTKLKI